MPTLGRALVARLPVKAVADMSQRAEVRAVLRSAADLRLTAANLGIKASRDCWDVGCHG